MNTEDNGNIPEAKENTKELSYVIKYLYENFEMLSRWTPEFTAKELLLVLALRGGQPRRVSDIAQMTGFSISTVSWLVDGLVKQKVVARRRDSNDRRVVLVKLAPKGQEAIEEYDRIFEEIADLFYGALTLEEQEVFLRLNSKVISKLKEKKAEHSPHLPGNKDEQ